MKATKNQVQTSGLKREEQENGEREKKRFFFFVCFTYAQLGKTNERVLQDSRQDQTSFVVV